MSKTKAALVAGAMLLAGCKGAATEHGAEAKAASATSSPLTQAVAAQQAIPYDGSTP